MTHQASFVDVAIIGGGPAGLALSIGLRQLVSSSLRIAVIDPFLGERDFRHEKASMTSAIAAGQRRMLEKFGVWDQVAGNTQAIRRMEITDSRFNDSIRPVLLEFGNDGPAGDILAHMVFHRDLEPALEQRARDMGVVFFQNTAKNIERRTASVEILLDDDQRLRTSLVVGADGRNSRVKKWAKIKSNRRDYSRIAIVATIGLERDHGGVAVQHFLPAGTLALLPLNHQRFSIVWVEHPVRAQQLGGSSQQEFLQELAMRIGHRWGDLKLLDTPALFPLSREIAREFTADRIVLLGDAAHAFHPLAGQGLNLGLQDVACLVEILSDGLKTGLDLGDATLLQAYQRSRQLDTVAMAALTDGLFDLFALEFGLVRTLRQSGMSFVNSSVVLKSRLVRHAAGDSGNAPPLFQ